MSSTSTWADDKVFQCNGMPKACFSQRSCFLFALWTVEMKLLQTEFLVSIVQCALSISQWSNHFESFFEIVHKISQLTPQWQLLYNQEIYVHFYVWKSAVNWQIHLQYTSIAFGGKKELRSNFSLIWTRHLIIGSKCLGICSASRAPIIEMGSLSVPLHATETHVGQGVFYHVAQFSCLLRTFIV